MVGAPGLVAPRELNRYSGGTRAMSLGRSVPNVWGAAE